MKTKQALLLELQEVEKQLKLVQKQFQDIKKRTKTGMVNARHGQDTKKLEQIRKQLGLL